MKRSEVRSRAAWARIAASAEKWARCRMLAMLTRAISLCCLQEQQTHRYTCNHSHAINYILPQNSSDEPHSTLGRNAERAQHSPRPSEAHSSYANKMTPCCTAPRTTNSETHNPKVMCLFMPYEIHKMPTFKVLQNFSFSSSFILLRWTVELSNLKTH